MFGLKIGEPAPQFLALKEKYIDSGVMGKVGLARTWYTSNNGYIQKAPPGMDAARGVGLSPIRLCPYNPGDGELC